MTTQQSNAEDVRRKAGRLLCVGVPGTRLDRQTRELLREVRPGGVVLFKRNIESPEQVALLNAQIRDALERRVLISVDQEGGLVDRLRVVCEPSPAAKHIRVAGRGDLAKRFGSLTARMLRLLGFNLNFAPVLDLSGENEENGLRGRTFGAHPNQVARLAGAYLDGLQAGGVLGCGKHFPGLGGSTVDSHRRLPVIKHSWQQILERDLVPFMDLMFHRPGERLHSIMISHAAFPEMTEFLEEWFRHTTRKLPSLEELAQMPATISDNVVMRLLRRALRYDGLVITDDMEMGAVVQTLSVAEASLRAITAGSDMILICEKSANVVAARDLICEAVADGRVELGALERSGARVDALIERAGEAEFFDGDDFEIVCRDIKCLKEELQSVDSSGEYAPEFGTAEGSKRRSSNF